VEWSDKAVTKPVPALNSSNSIDLGDYENYDDFDFESIIADWAGNLDDDNGVYDIIGLAISMAMSFGFSGGYGDYSYGEGLCTWCENPDCDWSCCYYCYNMVCDDDCEGLQIWGDWACDYCDEDCEFLCDGWLCPYCSDPDCWWWDCEEV
jgi:hypothetical protein